MSEADEIVKRAVELDAEEAEQEERAIAVATAHEMGLSETAVAGALRERAASGDRVLASTSVPARRDHVAAHLAEYLTRNGFERVSSAESLEVWGSTPKLERLETNPLWRLRRIECRYAEEDGSTALTLVGTETAHARPRQLATLGGNVVSAGLASAALLLTTQGPVMAAVLMAVLTMNVLFSVALGVRLRGEPAARLKGAVDEIRARAIASSSD